jgi:hypothetical protein
MLGGRFDFIALPGGRAPGDSSFLTALMSVLVTC